MVKGKVYILESRHHGSNQQLKVIARSIFPDHEAVGKRFELRSRSKLFRVLCSALIRLKRSVGGSSSVSKALSWLALRNGAVAVSDEDILIAKTPPFEYPAVLLAAGTRAKTVFLGTPKHFSPQDFDVVVSTPSTPCAQADIVLETLPTEVHQSSSGTRVKDKASPAVWSLVIGGDAKGYRYGDSFYRTLCHEMEKVSAATGVTWIVSTSPRTGAAAEAIIMEFIRAHPEAVEECILWGKGARGRLHGVFSRSEVALVTEDSASMVSEAVNLGMRTVCIRPDDAGFNSLVTPLLESLEKNQRILRIDMHELAEMAVRDLADFDFRPLQKNWIDSWVSQSRAVPPDVHVK